jgi:hypothetical protein
MVVRQPHIFTCHDNQSAGNVQWVLSNRQHSLRRGRDISGRMKRHYLYLQLTNTSLPNHHFREGFYAKR